MREADVAGFASCRSDGGAGNDDLSCVLNVMTETGSGLCHQIGGTGNDVLSCETSDIRGDHECFEEGGAGNDVVLSWLRDYGLLVTRYNRAFHEKWILGQASADEPRLGSADIQSLADLGSSFEYLRGMKVVPFSLRVVIQFALVTSLPCWPLILLVVPVGQILDLLSKAVF